MEALTSLGGVIVESITYQLLPLEARDGLKVRWDAKY